MKKILLFLLFIGSFPAFSQVQIPQEYTINKPLRLETVNAGSKSDSIIVRGADKILKYVPQSKIVSVVSDTTSGIVDNKPLQELGVLTN